MVISSTILSPTIKLDKAAVRSLYFRTTNEEWALDRRAAERRPFAVPAGFQPRVFAGSKASIGEPSAPPQIPFGEPESRTRVAEPVAPDRPLGLLDELEPPPRPRRRRKTRPWPTPKLERIERQVDPLPGWSIPRTGRHTEIPTKLREFRPVVPKTGQPLKELESLRFEGALVELRKQQERKYRFLLA